MSCFLDTNILVYAVSNDARMGRARQVMEGQWTISVQVLNEFIDVARRKMKLDWPNVDLHVQDVVDLADRVDPMTRECWELGYSLASRHQLRIYDSMIIASASLAGCGILYTEDLADGAVIAGVQIRNPFKMPPASA